MAQDQWSLAIKRLHVSNFKGFRDLDLELKHFNVLIGPNASGKTTIVEALRFVRDVARQQGLDNAVSLQGGVRFLRNLNLGASQELRISLVTNQTPHFRFFRTHGDRSNTVDALANELTHTLALRFRTRGLGYEVHEDAVTAPVAWYKSQRRQKSDGSSEPIGEGQISLRQVSGKLKPDFKLPEGVDVQANDIEPPYLSEARVPRGSTVAFGPAYYYFLPMVRPVPVYPMALAEIGIYDFDPKLPKRAAQISGKAELEEDGSNLALVLKEVVREREKRRKLLNVLCDLLPFVKDINVEPFADKSLLFKIKERFLAKEHELPASSISDGTINVIALILAVYFESKSPIVIEEPERNIHPSLIAKVVDMMKDASRHKQVIITTHNPEIVRHAGVDNLILLSRDDDGFCRATRATDSEQARVFLGKELGIDELYVGNLLQ